MKSIKSRLLLSYIGIIFLTVFILDFLLIISVRKYYYSNIQEILEKQAEVSGKFYKEYVNSKDLNNDATNLINTFSGSTSAQIQIIDTKYTVISDSSGDCYNSRINSPDVVAALKGNLAYWSGSIKETGEPIMSVSYPLKNNDSIIGAIRLITSLTDVKSTISHIILAIIISSILVLFFVLLLCLFIATTITSPVKKITKAAEEMALGDFNIRLEKKYDDEIGKLSDTLNYMAEEVLKQDKLKNEFIASVSHELRTPLTSINGWAITLGREEMQEKDKINYGLKIIETESLRLKSLVEDLLDFSKLSSGNIILRKEYIDINELLNYIINQMLPRAEREDITLTSNLAETTNLIYVDSNRIKQVIINLLDNSLKFTPPKGSILLGSNIFDNMLQIHIKDTGCGISKEIIESVKQKFFKGNNKVSGSGIGLAICDEIIKLHKGELVIESIENEGTNITIRLPL